MASSDQIAAEESLPEPSPKPALTIADRTPLVAVVLAAQSSLAEGLAAVRDQLGAARVWLARLLEDGRDAALIEEACAAGVAPWWEPQAEVRLPSVLVWGTTPREVPLADAGLSAWVLGAGAVGLVAMRSRSQPWQPEEQALLRDALLVLAGEQQRQTAQSLVPSLERVLGTLPLPAIATDVHRQIIWVNAAAAGAYGYPASALVGQPVRRLYADEQGWSSAQQAMSAASGAAPGGGTVEARYRRQDGSTFVGEAAGGLLRDAAGRPAGCVGVVRDLSARLAAEAQRLRAERLAGLGTMAGGLAHDFNNLLTPVLANAVALRGELRDPSQQEMVGEIEEAARRAAQLSGQLLAYLGQAPMQPTPQDLAVLVADTHTMLAASLPAEVRLELRLSAAHVVADPGLLRQVLWSLVTNAAEAMSPGRVGLIRVQVGQATLSAEALRQGRRELAPGSYAVLEVMDTGEGMTERTLERLFDPFFSTRFTGRGLGMAVVQGVVQAHHGDVLVDSTRGEGSRVRVVLPVRPPALAASPAAQPVAGRQVLLVEDDPAVQSVLSRLLRREGMVVHQAADGPTALEEAGRLGEALDLVLLDVSLPRLSGVVVLERLRQQLPTTPVILMSGHRPAELSARFSELGAVFLMKPFTVEDFTRTLRRLLP